MASFLNKQIVIQSVLKNAPISAGGLDKETCEDKHPIIREKTGGDTTDELFYLKPVKDNPEHFLITSLKCEGNLSHTGMKGFDKGEFVIFDNGFSLSRDQNTFKLNKVTEDTYAFKNVASGNFIEVYELPEPFPTFYHSCCTLALKSDKKPQDNPKFLFKLFDNESRKPILHSEVVSMVKNTPDQHKIKTVSKKLKGLSALSIAMISIGSILAFIFIIYILTKK
jgi:hypothetical protein